MAEAIGMPFVATPNIGYSVGVASLDIDDPAGSAESVVVFQPIRVVYTDKLTGGMPYRYWLEVFYHEGKFDASTSDIGQYVLQYGLGGSIQRKMWRSESWQSWFGAGIDMANTRYKDRHLIDSDGFLVARFPRREKLELGLLLNFSGDTRLARNVTLSAKVEHRFAFNEGINIFSMTATFLYRL